MYNTILFKAIWYNDFDMVHDNGINVPSTTCVDCCNFGFRQQQTCKWCTSKQKSDYIAKFVVV